MIGWIIEASIRHRWLVMAAVLGFVAFGVYEYQRLPVDAVPDITNVQVQVNAAAPGYSPLEVEQRVTFPIETAMAGLPRLDQTRSVSAYGISQVTVVFQDGTDIYLARQLVNERLQEVKGELPQAIVPQMGPISTGLGEIYFYTVDAKDGATKPDGSSYTSMDLRTIQDWIIRPQLRQVPGVSEVNSIGGYAKEYQVAPKPEKMLAFGVDLQELIQALEESNLNVGAGYIERNGAQFLVRIPGQLADLDAIRDVVVATRNGVPVTVGDVSAVEIGKELRTGAAMKDGRETVIGTALMLIGQNARVVSKRVAARLEEINKTLPQGVTATPIYDRTVLVNKSIATVQENILEGAVLVVVILLLFLGNLRAALLAAAVIPLALLATISGMVQAGVSGNLMSLGALDFGLIVDGALIIVENCVLRMSEAQRSKGRLLEQGERFETVFNATREVFRPSLVSVIVIVLVNLPIFALSGVEGKMFHPMAFAVVAALLGALLFSITFIPAGCALLFRGRIGEKENAILVYAKRYYEPLLRGALRFRLLVVLAAVVVIGTCGFFATRMGAEFIPNLDEGDIAVEATSPPSTGIHESVSMQAQLQRALDKIPEVRTVFARIGTAEVATDVQGPGVAEMFIMIKPRSEWPKPDKTKDTLVAELEAAANSVPGIVYNFSQPIQLRFNELIAGVKSEVAINIFGDNLKELNRLAAQVQRMVDDVPGAADVKTAQASGLPFLTITPRREALGRYGISVGQFQDTVRVAIGGRESGLIFDGDQRFPLVVRLPENLRNDPQAMKRLPIATPDEGNVPLGEVADLAFTQGPNQIQRENGKRLIVVISNVRGRDLNSFIQDVRSRVTSQVSLPAGYYIEYGGTFQQLSAATRRLSLLVPVVLLLIFGLLMMTFGSVKDALITFSGVPLALTGGVLALLVRGIPLSITAGVGFITLSGVSVLTGVVMISQIRALIREGVPITDAIVDGAKTRLRPILMIALVASLGFLPMALNTGTGAEVQRPLATVVIGGIISATLLSLFVLPALYRMFHANSLQAKGTAPMQTHEP